MQINGRREIVVPDTDKPKNDLRRDRRFYERQHDRDKALEVPRPVDTRRLEIGVRYAAHILHEEEQHRNVAEKSGQDERPKRIEHADRHEHAELRHHECGVRNHHAAHEEQQPERFML